MGIANYSIFILSRIGITGNWQAQTLPIQRSMERYRSANKEGNNMPDINDIIAWENGEMDKDQEIIFFQKLVDTGLA